APASRSWTGPTSPIRTSRSIFTPSRPGAFAPLPARRGRASVGSWLEPGYPFEASRGSDAFMTSTSQAQAEKHVAPQADHGDAAKSWIRRLAEGRAWLFLAGLIICFEVWSRVAFGATF